MIQVEVVDPEGHRLSGADVAVTVWYCAQLREPRVGPDADEDRRRGPRPARGRSRTPGGEDLVCVRLGVPTRACASRHRSSGSTGKGPPRRALTLDQPAKWTITVLGPDDRPIAGLRLAPYSLRRATDRTQWFTVPDEWADRLTATTDARGVATLTYLPHDHGAPGGSDRRPGVRPAPFPFECRRERTWCSSWAGQGDWSGSSVRHPASRWPASRWKSGSRERGPCPVPLPVGGSRPTPSSRSIPGRCRPGLKAQFQTPPTPAERLELSRVHPAGRIRAVRLRLGEAGRRAHHDPRHPPPAAPEVDRAGPGPAGPRGRRRPGLPAGGRSRNDDRCPRAIHMAGIHPGKAVILVEQAGFRLQGWLVDPSSQAEVGPLTLVRTGEAPGPVMKPMADPIPPEESRALADRLLEPYLPADPEKGDDRARLAAIAVLGEFDMARASTSCKTISSATRTIFIKAPGSRWRPRLRRRTRHGPRPWPRRSRWR